MGEPCDDAGREKLIMLKFWKLPEPPRKDYRYLTGLDDEGWYKELTRLYQLSVEHDLGLHKADPNIVVRREASEGGKAGEVSIGQIGMPLVQVIEQRDEGECLQRDPLQLLVYSDTPDQYLLDTGFRLPRERMPALIVDLTAPDENILDGVREILEERKHQAFPRRNPGPRSLSKYFDNSTFDIWLNYHIVQLADLLAWRAEHAKRDPRVLTKYRNQCLGEIAGLYEPKKISLAINKILPQAIASLPPLLAQIVHRMAAAK
jgi:hypothetical protein